jgi:hypothetical protein
MNGITLTVLFFGLTVVSVASGQNACETCNHFIDSVTTSEWYRSSTDQQRDYFKSLETLDSSLDEFKKTFHGDTAGQYAYIFSGNVAVDQNYFETHKKEIRTKLEELIRESYKNTTVQRFPESVIKAVEECHQRCLGGESLSCEVLPTDKNTVVLNVEYHQSPTVRRSLPTYKADILVPAGVKTIPLGSNRVNGSVVQPGPNLLELDRRDVPGSFTLLAKTSFKQCAVVAPAMTDDQKPVSNRNACVFEAGFAHQAPNRLINTFTCRNMTPGDNYIAAFRSSVTIDKVGPQGVQILHKPVNWSQIFLTSPTAEPSWDLDTSRVDLIDNSQGRADVMLTGTVPSKDDVEKGVKAGEVSVEMHLYTCQVEATPDTCSTTGPARFYILSGGKWPAVPETPVPGR